MKKVKRPYIKNGKLILVGRKKTQKSGFIPLSTIALFISTLLGGGKRRRHDRGSRTRRIKRY